MLRRADLRGVLVEEACVQQLAVRGRRAEEPGGRGLGVRERRRPEQVMVGFEAGHHVLLAEKVGGPPARPQLMGNVARPGAA